MINQTIPKTGEDMIYLIAVALHNIKPDEKKVEQMNIEELYQLSKFHSLSSITYDALESMDNIPSHPILEKWREDRDKVCRKNLMLDAARKKLFKYLDKNQIWHMPLKGTLIKEMYPKQEMRQMADNDILFDADYEADVKQYFEKEGYEVVYYGKGNHDVYNKAPIYNFEMHTALFGANHNSIWTEYYKNVKSRLIKEDNSFQMHFTDEDFYVYFTVHNLKHFNGAGTGIRSFVDCYVYQMNMELDWKYIEGELTKLGVLEEEKKIRNISFKIFGEMQSVDSLDDEEYVMLCCSMYSGTYGTLDSEIKNKLSKLQKGKKNITILTKLKYCFIRVFPPASFYEMYFPKIYKIKILRPFLVVFRIFRGIIIKNKKIRKEFKTVWKK